MKIALTGGGTGGHFYPLIAVAEEIYNITREDKLLEPHLYYIGPDVHDARALSEQNIEFKKSPAGKMRKYFSVLNFTDLLKTAVGIVKATIQLYFLYPDVVFSKGGYAAFPTTVAARLLRIPLIVHESDAHPGKANLIAAKWARGVATSYPGAAKHFGGIPEEKFALTGNPIRSALFIPVREGAHNYLGMDPDVPTILILGGSTGAAAINKMILNALPLLVENYQVIHQVGKENIDHVNDVASVVLQDNPHAGRYKVFGYLNQLALRMSAGIASIVITRAGSSAIAEVAGWGLPAIVIPIPGEVSHDQTDNAFTYARTGAATVMKQKNLTPNLLVSEVERIMGDAEIQSAMTEAASKFAKPDAARKIARMLLDIGLEHED